MPSTFQPNKIGDVPTLLKKYKGREVELRAKMEKKYAGRSPLTGESGSFEDSPLGSPDKLSHKDAVTDATSNFPIRSPSGGFTFGSQPGQKGPSSGFASSTSTTGTCSSESGSEIKEKDANTSNPESEETSAPAVVEEKKQSLTPFGALPSTQSTTELKKPATTDESGSTSTATPVNSGIGSTFSFGSLSTPTTTAPVAGLFGSSTTTPVTGGFGSFGSASTSTTNSPAAGGLISFGSPSTTNTPVTGGFGSFGSPNTTVAAPAAGVFGSSTTPAGGGFGSFGSSPSASTTTAPVAGGFGSSTTPAGGGFGSFGSSPSASTTTAPVAGGFGSSTTPAGGGFGSFGSSPSTSTTTAPVTGGFGIVGSAPSGGGFGSSGTIGGTTTTAPDAEANSLTLKLLDLSDTRRQALISDQEFDRMRKQILENFTSQGW